MNEEIRRAEEFKTARRETQDFLRQMKNHGVELYVDGKSVSPGEAAARTVRENSPYMADYVMGENGMIQQVRFDRVKSR